MNGMGVSEMCWAKTYTHRVCEVFWGDLFVLIKTKMEESTLLLPLPRHS